MKIREATLSDVGGLILLNDEVQSIHINISPTTFRETQNQEVAEWLNSLVNNEKIQVFVTILNDKIVGYLILNVFVLPKNPFMHERKYAHIDHLCVSETVRKRGIGQLLIEHAIKYCKAHALNAIELTVWSDNVDAKNAFKKIGFINRREQMRLEL